MRENGSW